MSTGGPSSSPDFSRGTSPNPADAADDLFAHGLLEILHETDDARRTARVQRVMQAIAEPAARARDLRHRRRMSRFLGAGTMIFCIAAAVLFLASPATTPSYASIQDSITAMRGPGDRRYQISAAFGPKDDAVVGEPHATLDTSFPSLMLLELRRPDGGTVIVGRDEQGEWAIMPDGQVDRADPRRAWPGWAISDGESMFADSVDQWLEAAAQAYVLSKPDRQKLPGSEGPEFDHIIGIRKPAPGPMALRLRSADRIEVWIDPTTKVVERMEMGWKPRPVAGAGPGPSGGPSGPGDGTRRDRPLRGPFPGDRPDFDDAGPPDPQNRQDVQPEGVPPPPHGPEGSPPPDDDRLGPEGPDRGPRRPHPPQGPRNGPFQGPPRALGDGPGGPPELRDGPARRPPLRRLVIERVQAPAFEPAWFNPDAHIAKVMQDQKGQPDRPDR